MTEEEKDSIMRKAQKAILTGNKDEAKQLLRLLPVPAGFAMELKKAVGADTMKRLDRNYEEAEVKYGHDWLEGHIRNY